MNINVVTLIIYVLFLYDVSSASAQSWSFEATNARGAFTGEAKEHSRGRIEAFIGRRASMRNGEVSSLRWLSRLMEQQPGGSQYVVEWFVKAQGKWWNVATIFEPSRDLQFVAARSSVEKNPPFFDKEWRVSSHQIEQAARRKADFGAFPKPVVGG